MSLLLHVCWLLFSLSFAFPMYGLEDPRPMRIASCSLATDEIALAILGEIGGEERLIALSRFAANPAYSNAVQKAQNMRGRCGTELESLISLKPDLVLLAPYSRPEFIRQVEKSKINLFTTSQPHSLDSIEATIKELGARLGEHQATEKVLARMRQRRKAIPKSPAPVKPALLHVFENGSVSGADTMFDAIAQEVGAVNILASQGIRGWPKLSTEHLATLKPDFVVIGGDPQRRMEILSHLRGQPGFRDIPAIKTGQIILIQEKFLGSVSHHVMEAIEILAKELRPAPKRPPSSTPN